MKRDPESPLGERDDGTWQRPLPSELTNGARTHAEEPDFETPAIDPLTTEFPSVQKISDTRLRGSSDSGNPFSSGSRESSDSLVAGPPPVIEAGREVFEGKYRLIKKLGEGAMGQVWLVENLALNTESALKLLKLDNVQAERARLRFKREAKLMRALKHPRAVAVYDFGSSSSIGYIEMEYVRGETLQQILEENPEEPMPLEWIAPILDQLCAVLQEAHGHRDEKTGTPKPIVHRDLKPSNLMLVDDKKDGQNLKVLDFGIAKIVEDDQMLDQNPQLTNLGEFVGTVGYCSPEQIRNGAKASDNDKDDEFDGRSDIYSVGVILYQLLTGRLPFRGNYMAVFSAHLMTPPEPLSKANPKAKIPAEIERLVLQCLEKDPAKRPQTAQELADRFHAAADRVLPTRSRIRTLALTILAVLSITGVAYAIVLIGPGRGTSTGTGIGGSIEAPPRPPPTAPGPKIWEPPGYKAVDRKKVKRGPGGWLYPTQLTRAADGVTFDCYKEGMYLPEGYKPEDPSELEGDWPRAIVRESEKDTGKPTDRVRFIRIKGKQFECGDTRESPFAGAEPLWVSVSDFYILETEVTNRLMEEYLQRYHEDASLLEKWRESVDLIKLDDPHRFESFAAIEIVHRVAEKCAGFLGGRLPTEAEWEYAAKSARDAYMWPWGVDLPKGGRTMAHLLGTSVSPAPVKRYETDKSEQGVYGLTGNVREWCLDPFKLRSELIPTNNSLDNPLVDRPWNTFAVNKAKADQTASYVVRGGSFFTDLNEAMVFKREKRNGVTDDFTDVGFRVVIDCPPLPTNPDAGQ